ncbi:xylosidase/arabinosidase [mine drainage metagenome]|uniref:Xylosidase/arabinosidase n=1 Tax=mine drainage metagenome TaxID=410659 RepID=A0A1J5R2A2_9ZZZZ
MKHLPTLLSLCAALMFTGIARANNPLIPTVFAADPSAHVWPNDDRIWLYCSHDQPGTNTNDTMDSYHVFSSSDLVHWIDYGVVLHLKDVTWAISHMWAPDCVLWKGTYYLVYCAKEKGTGMFRTGLATSQLPQGPFRDIGYIRGVEHGQDPALFVDDDGTPYLYWGSGGVCHGARLSDDLRSVVPGTTVDLTSQLKYVYEGPWVHKYRGQYYLSYPGLVGGKWPEKMYYATASRPLGPYKFRGCYISDFKGQSGTNHGSIIEFRNRWLAFYHSAWVSGGLSEVRNLMCDYLHYNSDGTIKRIVPSHLGVAVGTPPGPSKVTVLLEAENGPAAYGELRGTRVADAITGFTGTGYVEGFEGPGNSVMVMAQSAEARRAELKIRYREPEGPGEYKVEVNDFLIRDPVRGYVDWEKLIQFPKAANWTEFDVGPVELRQGNNFIKLYSGARGGHIQVDSFELDPLDQR